MKIFSNRRQLYFFFLSTLVLLILSTTLFVFGLYSTWGLLISSFDVKGNNLDLASFPFALASLGTGFLGWLLGLGVSFLLIKTLTHRWAKELGEDKVRLTCLSFLTFLILLTILILNY